MQKNQINRRGFLRVCLLGASSAIAAACGSRLDRTIPAEKTSLPTPRLTNEDAQDASWLDTAIIYRVTPSGPDGRFDRLALRLGSLQELGVNLLWLGEVYQPLNGSQSAASGEAVLNAQYGSREGLIRLVRQAHRLGIRVLVDFPPVSAVESYARWVRDFDLDGFRLDTAWEMKESQAGFWPRLRRELKRIKPDLVLLAEASAGDPFYFEQGFDAAQDWAVQDRRWSWELAFQDERLLTSNLHTALLNRPNGYHPGARILRSLSDGPQARFASKYGPEMARLASALLFTLPGLPCLYPEDESGESSEPSSAARPVTETRAFPGLTAYQRQLIRLRRETPSLHSRSWVPLEVGPHSSAYGFLRFTEAGEDPVLVLLNFLELQTELEVNLPPEYQPWFATSSALKDLLTGETVQLTNPDPFRVILPGRSVRIISK